MKNLVSACLVVAGLGLRPIGSALAQARTIHGVAFVVDTARYGGPIDAILNVTALKVTYAGTRGRVDVLARTKGPAVRAKWVILSPSMAMPGDYYLFDGTGFILVRPAKKQFSSFKLADVSFNYEGRRDGWPFFRFDPYEPEILSDESLRASERPHGDFSIYWHAELMRDTSCKGPAYGRCQIGELARGRAIVVYAPPEELAVTRWFGPAEALARIGGLDSLVGRPIHLVSIGQWKAPAGGDSVTTITTIRFLSNLRVVTVHPAMLTLPRGFKETPWPNYENTKRVSTLSADGGAKWRILPR